DARKHEVEHDQIDFVDLEALQSLLSRAGLNYSIALALERIGEELLYGLLVVDKEDRGDASHRQLRRERRGDKTIPTTIAPPRMAAPSHPSRALGPRRRARRGSLERPVSGRIYRVTWALIAFPLLVAAFTVGRPDTLPRAGLPPSFDQAAAAQLARDFAD